MVSADKWRDIGGVQKLTSSLLLLRKEINVPTGGKTGDYGARVWAKHGWS
jgi:hypothetical protein